MTPLRIVGCESFSENLDGIKIYKHPFSMEENEKGWLLEIAHGLSRKSFIESSTEEVVSTLRK
jgi:hypothetical protein